MERDSSGRRGWSVSLTGQVPGQILGGSSETLAQTVGEPAAAAGRALRPLQGARYHLSFCIPWKCGHHTESIVAVQTYVPCVGLWSQSEEYPSTYVRASVRNWHDFRML